MTTIDIFAARSNILNSRLKKFHPKPYKAYWLLLSIFFVGYLLTYSKLSGFWMQYLLLTIVSAFCACVMLTCLNRLLVGRLVVWILFLVWVVTYYIQWYLIACYPEMAGDHYLKPLRWLAYSPEVLMKTFSTITYGFGAFCLAVWLLVAKMKAHSWYLPRGVIDYNNVCNILLWLIPCLMGVTFIIANVTGINRMGEESVYLPLHLAGLIYYCRVMLIPALLLLLIWCSDEAGLRKYFVAGTILLLIHGISDMLLRSSRGALLLLFIGLFFLLSNTNRMIKNRLYLFIGVIFFTLLAWPIITSYRSVREHGYQSTISHTLYESITNPTIGTISYSDELIDGIKSLFFRYGAVSLIPMSGVELEPLKTQCFSTSVTRVYTVEVMGYPPQNIHASGPSFVGWFYLVGGNPFVIIGTFGFTVLVLLFWQMLERLRLYCLPVARSIFLLWVLLLLGGGPLDSLALGIMTLTGSIIGCEYIMRMSGIRQFIRSCPGRQMVRQEIRERDYKAEPDSSQASFTS